MSTIRAFAAFQLVVMDVGNDGMSDCNITPGGGFVRSIVINVGTSHVCICPKLDLEAESRQLPCRGDGTHVKDTKNSVEIQLPGGDRRFIILGVIASRDRIPSPPLDDVPLDPVHGPDRELGEEIARRTHRSGFNSRRQFHNRLENGLIELIRLLSVYPPTEDFAGVGAG